MTQLPRIKALSPSRDFHQFLLSAYVRSAKIYTESELPKASAAGFSAWSALSTALLSGAVCLILIMKQKRMELPDAPHTPRKALFQSFGIGALMGSINKVANFLLVLSLVHVDASIQYPMVTAAR